ncbi:MAG: ADP-ribosylglycohydrolase family protein [Oscillospiraceae bacterium]|jgi:ADP-ribosylglycohydrolase|nr:ADP-ribosylglycohydrolase family protein [Oscillospiraceae bacterium]
MPEQLYHYPNLPDFRSHGEKLHEYARLASEYGASSDTIASTLESVERMMLAAIQDLQSLPADGALSAKEPDALEAIKSLRPSGKRVLWERFDADRYRDRLAGAFMGRMAGVTLGAPVEFWTVDAMRGWAAYIGDSFPPTDYWSAITNPVGKRYGISRCEEYTRPLLNKVPVDDDVTYTMLGLLIAEEYGLGFTVEDVGAAWLKYLPYACTAEDAALKNLKKGIPAGRAAESDNPYVQWIGADIRSDPWGYLAPGSPELAARMARADAWISHRRNGIYGEMYFSAAIAAAFALDDPMEALRLGLNEIPADCLLARDVRWALDVSSNITNAAQARETVEARFNGMSGVHTNLNACLTIFALGIGRDDFTKTIGETVAMGYDNDCTAGTAGSVFGAARGIGAIPEKWYKPFNDRVMTYMNGQPEFSIKDTLARFEALARLGFA